MKRTAIISVFFGITLICMPNLNAQEVVSSGGMYFESSTGSVSWTIGELAISTLQGGDLILTQGFHQTKLNVTGLDIIPGPEPEISAFPNPTADKLNIKLQGIPETNDWNYIIYDIQGRVVLHNRITSDITEISINKLPESSYYLRVYSEIEGSKVFKIAKQ